MHNLNEAIERAISTGTGGKVLEELAKALREDARDGNEFSYDIGSFLEVAVTIEQVLGISPAPAGDDQQISDETIVLIGKLVVWQSEGQWLTARVESPGARSDTWRGQVVDPGNYTGLSQHAPKAVAEGRGHRAEP